MRTAIYASLVDRGVTLDGILHLTPRQITEIYNHPRDDKGDVIVPRTEDNRGRLDALIGLIHAGAVKATPEQVAKLVRMRDDGGGLAAGDTDTPVGSGGSSVPNG